MERPRLETVALPDYLAGGGLAEIAADGPDDVWVAGADATGALVLAHWNGRSGTSAPAPATGFGFTNLGKLVIAGPDEAWLTRWGETAAKGGADRVSLILHWNGSTWALSPTPPGGGELYDMSLTVDGP